MELPQLVQCSVCRLEFCSACRNSWHKEHACQDNTFRPGETRAMATRPSCKVYIERDKGCAQMMCKSCKRTFCWYWSLEDDLLLNHYDKGPCRNKLGLSRASVIWHRTQVVGIFAGFVLLLLLASLFLLLASSFILCCKCKCSKGDDDPLST
uniref:Ring finger protein 144ab n=1 Tax=Oncorhynchus mykiss TaxID=8022 RepID=A0A8K9Y886_ONCMY